ncbi:MAG TPA: glutaredoxin family protein [Isosphaeraceae bacterium]|nr:glutaredoxin family protein [Isosphaeraceae bacterium]
MTSLLTRLLGRSPHTEHLTFTVYSRAQCCCCHKVLDLLREYQRQFRFAIEEVDIDGDPELVTRYDTEVPVVAVNGKVRFRGVVNRTLLDRLLRGESRNRQAPAGETG